MTTTTNPILDEERAAWGRLAEAATGPPLGRDFVNPAHEQYHLFKLGEAARLALPRLLAENAELRHVARVLAVLSIQSERYGKDPDFRQAVDDALAATKSVKL